MCGRAGINITQPQLNNIINNIDNGNVNDNEIDEEVMEEFNNFGIVSNYEIRPSTSLLCIEKENNKIRVCKKKWGISIGNYKMRHNKIENIEKNKFKKNRCLIIINEFYINKKDKVYKFNNVNENFKNVNENKFKNVNENIILIAGVYSKTNCVSMVTRESDDNLLKYVHERYPLVITNNNIENWLNEKELKKDKLKFSIKKYSKIEINKFFKNKRNEFYIKRNKVQ